MTFRFTIATFLISSSLISLQAFSMNARDAIIVNAITSDDPVKGQKISIIFELCSYKTMLNFKPITASAANVLINRFPHKTPEELVEGYVAFSSNNMNLSAFEAASVLNF